MPPIDVARESHQLHSDAINAKAINSSHAVAAFEPAHPPPAVPYRDKEFGVPGGFENIVNGRYSGIGRGGSVGDELVCDVLQFAL